MKLTRSDRSLIAWTLYFCVLFNVFACGLAHGQVTGLTLNGVGGQFCSSQGSSAPTSKTDLADLSASGWAGSFACPICSSVTLSIALLFCLGWLLRIAHDRVCLSPLVPVDPGQPGVAGAPRLKVTLEKHKNGSCM